MNEDSETAAALAVLTTEIRYLSGTVAAVTARLEAAEIDRRARAEALAVRESEQDKKIERLAVTVGILAAAGGTIASAGMLWIISRVLGLI